MGLRCLLGHDFTEPRTERDREERGDEVVVSITEVKECKRCGETRVVSESKEVTSLTDHAGISRAESSESADSAQSAETTSTGVESAATAPDVDAGTDRADADAGAAAEGDQPDVAEAEPEASPDEGFDHPAADLDDEEAAADVAEDAEIIDGTEPGEPTDADAEATGEAGRAHGEWPDADANRRDGDAAAADEQAAWPDDEAPAPADGQHADAGHSPAEGESEDVEILGDDGEDAEDAAANEARTDVVPDAGSADEAGAVAPGEDDAEFIDGDGPSDWPDQGGEDEGYDAEVGSEETGVSVDGNLTPQVDADAGDGGEDVEFIEADPSAGQSAPPSAHNGSEPYADAERASSRPQVELTTTSERVETVYVCPDCGNREPVGASSMRAGDICPDCKRGYIEERELR